MTTPPDGDNRDDEPWDYPPHPGEPESGYPVPPAYGPPPPPASGPPSGYPHYRQPPAPGQPYPQWQPQQPYPQWQPQQLSRISIGLVFAGCAVWAVVNVFVALAAILVSAGTKSGSDNVVLGIAALGLVVIAFGVGGALLAARNRYAKGLGLGLMIGWALTSLFTVGFCTGINPGMYTL